MWPFKKKEKEWKPKSDFDYFLLGIAHARQLRKEIGRQPVYRPSKIIQPK